MDDFQTEDYLYTSNPPNWSEYVFGNLLKESEGQDLKTLEMSELQPRDTRFRTIAAVLCKQPNQEVIYYLVSILRAVCDWRMDDDAQRMLIALSLVLERFGMSNKSLFSDLLLVLGRIVSENSQLLDISPFFNTCRQLLNTYSPEYCIEVTACLAHTLQDDLVKRSLARNGQLLCTLVDILSKVQNQPQLHYNVFLCLWLISFDTDSLRRLLSLCNVIPVTVMICRCTTKEKVIRVGVGFWRNLLEKCHDDVLPIMIGSKVFEFVGNCLKKHLNDSDLIVDLTLIQIELEKAITRLSTFDEYASEVKSEILEWTPPHKSCLFWKDNALRMNENEGELLKYRM